MRGSLRGGLPVWGGLLLAVIAGARGAGKVPGTAATRVASRYLLSIESTESYCSPGGLGHDYVFVGNSHRPSEGWRVVVVRERRKKKPAVVWDSFCLADDTYFSVVGLNGIKSREDGTASYVVEMRGCVPHQCADGKIGLAVYASRTGRVYLSHVDTEFEASDEKRSYRVTYKPKSGVPEIYRRELNRMMCSDPGISQKWKLPFVCAAQ